MRLLILVPTAEGHFLEYLEYLFKIAQLRSDDFFIFVLHPLFERVDVVETIKHEKNTKVTFLTEYEKTFSNSYLKSAYQRTKILRKYSKMENVDSIFLIMTMPYSPFIFIPYWKKWKIYGIIYDIYLYRWKSNTILKKIYDVLRFYIFSKYENFKSIFILNDYTSAAILNKIYHTNKFIGLPDPFRPISSVSCIYKLRDTFKNKIIISHIGSLKERKGTYDILNAIEAIDPNVAEKYAFVFAGKAKDPEYIKKRIESLRAKIDILLIEGFIGYDNIGEIVEASDLLLLPYHNTNQSSGIIGYAAQYGVPVVVPQKELLGRIVKKYHLGTFINNHKVESIKTFLESFHESNFKDIISNKRYIYMEENNVDNFINVINKSI